jgi:hypothetical protein
MERPEVGPKGETRGIERVKLHEFSRMGSGFTREFCYRFICVCLLSSWFDVQEVGSATAEEDLGVLGEGNPGKSQTVATRDDPKKDLSLVVKKPIGDL